MEADCYCDYDPPDFTPNVKVRRARKAHRCDECGAFIQPGEKYEYVFGVWDGFVHIYHTCERCLDLRWFITEAVPCFCWAYSTLHDDALECAREYAPHADGLLFGTYRRILRAKKHRQAQSVVIA